METCFNFRHEIEYSRELGQLRSTAVYCGLCAGCRGRGGPLRESMGVWDVSKLKPDDLMNLWKDLGISWIWAKDEAERGSPNWDDWRAHAI